MNQIGIRRIEFMQNQDDTLHGGPVNPSINFLKKLIDVIISTNIHLSSHV